MGREAIIVMIIILIMIMLLLLVWLYAAIRISSEISRNEEK